MGGRQKGPQGAVNHAMGKKYTIQRFRLAPILRSAKLELQTWVGSRRKKGKRGVGGVKKCSAQEWGLERATRARGWGVHHQNKKGGEESPEKGTEQHRGGKSGE